MGLQACDLQQRGDLLGLFDEDMRMNFLVKEAEMVLTLAILCTNPDPELRPTMSEVVVNILAILCTDSNYTTRFESTTNTADVISHHSSSTTMHPGNAVSLNDVFDYNDGAATASSSSGISEVDEFSKDIDLHHDFVSNAKVSVGKVKKSDVLLSQVTTTSAEPLGLNVKPQTSSISKDTYNQKGKQSKLENGYYTFQFSCIEERMRVLESADLWRIRKKQLILREWNWNLWTPAVLSKVGSGLGTPLYADQKTKNKEQLAYAMICIEFNASNPLPETLHILVKGMECHLKLEYDWRPLRCENCCTFGHIDLNCRQKMKAKKQN